MLIAKLCGYSYNAQKHLAMIRLSYTLLTGGTYYNAVPCMLPITILYFIFPCEFKIEMIQYTYKYIQNGDLHYVPQRSLFNAIFFLYAPLQIAQTRLKLQYFFFIS